MSFSKVDLQGIPFARLTEDECIEHVVRSDQPERDGGWIITANLDHMLRFTRDEGYRDLCNQASLVVADGMPIIWAARLQRTPLPERIAGSNLISTLSDAAGANGMSVFLLGGNAGVADSAAVVLREQYPGLKIAGTHFPPFGFEKDPEQMAAIKDALTAADPDIVYVALGSPKQELLIAQLRDAFPRVWWIGIGISFSYLCGDVKRAPRWMQQTGLEWLYRLVQEPRRLAKRYLVHDLPFGCLLLGRATLRGMTGGGRRVENN